MDYSILNPLEIKEWDSLLIPHKRADIFHTSSWAKVLIESYQYQPLYFGSLAGKKLTNLLAVMSIESRLTGKRGVSLPFSDYCRPLYLNQADFQDFLNNLLDYGRKAGWRYLEIRGSEAESPGLRPSCSFFTHDLDLTNGPETIFSRFSEATRRNIRKSDVNKIRVEHTTSLEALREFFRLNVLTRRKHGLPPQPFLFFEKLHAHIISKGHGFTSLAYHQNQVISGAVFLHFNCKAMFKYGASDQRYLNLRGNNAVMWHAIGHLKEKGNLKSLSLGRTDQNNQGLKRFKSGFGTTESMVHYYRYDFGKRNFVSHSGQLPRWQKMGFRSMPLGTLTLIGKHLYRHIG